MMALRIKLTLVPKHRNETKKNEKGILFDSPSCVFFFFLFFHFCICFLTKRNIEPNSELDHFAMKAVCHEQTLIKIFHGQQMWETGREYLHIYILQK